MFIESIINQALSLNPKTSFYLEKLSGKSLAIKIKSFMFSKVFFIVWSNQGIQCFDQLENPPDAIIEGSIKAFLKFIIIKDLHQANQLGLSFEGDIETLEYTQHFFSNLSIDWEEYLSHWTGDRVAIQFGRLAHTFQKNSQEFMGTAKQSVSEYLKEELKIVPTRLELNHFFNDVDTLRTDVERLEALLDHLMPPVQEPVK